MSLSYTKPKPEDGNRYWKVTTEPTVEPVSVEDIKMFARIDGDYEDDLIQALIVGVREATQQYLGRSLIQQTITMTLDFWPQAVIQLPRPPLISVDSVKTIDEDGTKTTYSSDNYYLNTIAEPGQLILKSTGDTFPDPGDRYYMNYEIIFKAGYGTLAINVPQAIREGMKTWVTFLYENRQPIDKPPFAVSAIFTPYRIRNV
jgi:uncharacterized phiE125 gp8 family phage protein